MRMMSERLVMMMMKVLLPQKKFYLDPWISLPKNSSQSSMQVIAKYHICNTIYLSGVRLQYINLICI